MSLMIRRQRVGIWVDIETYKLFRRFVSFNFSEWVRAEMKRKVNEVKSKPLEELYRV